MLLLKLSRPNSDEVNPTVMGTKPRKMVTEMATAMETVRERENPPKTRPSNRPTLQPRTSMAPGKGLTLTDHHLDHATSVNVQVTGRRTAPRLNSLQNSSKKMDRLTHNLINQLMRAGKPWKLHSKNSSTFNIRIKWPTSTRSHSKERLTTLSTNPGREKVVRRCNRPNIFVSNSIHCKRIRNK